MQSIHEAQQETYKVIQDFVKNTEKAHQETEKSIDRISEKHVETEKSIDRISEKHAETEKSIREFTEQSENSRKEMQKMLKNLSRRFGDLSNRFGEIAEQMVFPGIVARFNELGYKFNKEFNGNFKVRKNNQVIAEIDALLENGTTIAVVEIKTKPVVQDIDKHIQRIEKLKQNRLELQEPPKKIIGAIAGATFPKEVKEAAIQAGFYAIVQSGDTMKFDVPEGFTPKCF
jgi:hypothetical protein